MRRSVVPWIVAAAGYVLLTVAITWPLALHPGSRVPNDLGDSLLNMFLLAWDARELPFTAHCVDDEHVRCFFWRCLVQIPQEGDSPLGGAVTCYTCHRGEQHPMTAPAAAAKPGD